MKWPYTYHGPAGTEVQVRRERDVMGESELHVRVRSSKGGVFYSAVDPHEAMAFSADGKRLYIQDQSRQGSLRTRVISAVTGRKYKKSRSPLVGDSIVTVSDLIQAAGGDLINGARFKLVSRVAAKAATMTSAQRLEAVTRLLQESAPRAAVWHDLMELFRQWAPSDMGQGVDHALALLDERWDDFRIWVPWMRVLKPHPAWRLLTAGPEDVSLYRQEIGDDGVRALAAEPLMRSLTSLKLVSNSITEQGVAALVGPRSQLKNLQILSLSTNPIGDDGALTLARSATLSSLTTLSIAECKIGPEGAKALAGSRHLTRLKNLIMSFNPIREDGARALAESMFLNPSDRPESKRCHIVQSALDDKTFHRLLGHPEKEPKPI